MTHEFTSKDLNKITSYRDLVAYGLISPSKVEILKKEFSEISLFLYWIGKKIEGRRGDLTNLIKDEITRQIKGPLIRHESRLLRQWFDGQFLKNIEGVDDHLEEHFHSPHNWEFIILQLHHQLQGYRDHDFSVLKNEGPDAVKELLLRLKETYKEKTVLVIGSWWAGELFFELGAEAFTVTLNSERIPLSQKHSEEDKKILDKNFLKETNVKSLVNPSADEPLRLQKFREHLIENKVDFLISYQVFNHVYFDQYEANDVIASLRQMFLAEKGIEFHDRSY